MRLVSCTLGVLLSMLKLVHMCLCVLIVRLLLNPLLLERLSRSKIRLLLRPRVEIAL